jgi:hypothetical protein
MLINNQIAPEGRDWSYLMFDGLPPGPGVLFEEVTLDERIGAEAVALLIDPKPDDLLASLRLNLNLKAGIAATAYGPVLFLIWWIPPIVNGLPSAHYEQVMNPLYIKTSEVLRRLADQTHLHVLLSDAIGQILTVFEYKNTFGFDVIRAGVDERSARDYLGQRLPAFAESQLGDLLGRISERGHQSKSSVRSESQFSQSGGLLRVPYVIDNQGHKLSDILNHILQEHGGRSLDSASAYFTVGGFGLLQRGLESLGNFRLILGAEPTTGEQLGMRPEPGLIKGLIKGDLETMPFDEKSPFSRMNLRERWARYLPGRMRCRRIRSLRQSHRSTKLLRGRLTAKRPSLHDCFPLACARTSISGSLPRSFSAVLSIVKGLLK